MKTLLTTRGLFATLSDRDYKRIAAHKWHAVPAPRDLWYAQRVNNATGKVYYMHHVVLSITDGSQVDHIDGNGLNNQRDNLRRATYSQNQLNARKRLSHKGKPPTSEYKGVFKWAGRWWCELTVDKKRKRYGPFGTQIAAAKHYNEMAVLRANGFAKLNDV